jgi:hypothetical protein
MLKKIALASLFAVATMIGAAGPVAATSGTTKSVKPTVNQPAPKGLCPFWC